MSSNELSQRQKSILYAIVKEYCETNTSIGSNELKDKYRFGFSSATIRNELTILRDLGYLYQPYKNSGSIPTEIALKLFINILLGSLEISSQHQKALQNKIHTLQTKQHELSKEIAQFLADQVGGAGFALTGETGLVKGLSNLLKHPTQSPVGDLLDFLENIDQYKQLLLEGGEQHNNINMMVGGDNPILPLGKGYALVSTQVTLENGEKSVIGVISPLSLLAKKKNLELITALNTAFDTPQKRLKSSDKK